MYSSVFSYVKGLIISAPEISKPLPFSSISSGVPIITRSAIFSLRIFSAASKVLLSIDSGRMIFFLSILALSLILSINLLIIVFIAFLPAKYLLTHSLPQAGNLRHCRNNAFDITFKCKHLQHYIIYLFSTFYKYLFAKNYT